MLDLKGNARQPVNAKAYGSVTSTKDLRKSKAASIVWGIDPANIQNESVEQMRCALTAWNLNDEVLPVSILPRNKISEVAAKNRTYREKLNQQLSAKLGHLALNRLHEHKVLVEKKKGLAQTLIDFAVESKAEFIAINTQLTNQSARWLIGSFAETLIGTSPVPVLTLNPTAHIPKTISKILFATKFSKSSRHAFKQILKWSKEREAELVLMHKYEKPFIPGVYGEYGMALDANLITSIIEDAEQVCEKNMQRWVKAAHKAGVKCKGVVARDSYRIAESIMLCADEQKVDTIVVTTQRGPIGQRLVGSAAREILISADHPVIVMHDFPDTAR